MRIAKIYEMANGTAVLRLSSQVTSKNPKLKLDINYYM